MAVSMLTLDQYFNKQKVTYASDLTPEIERNAYILIARVNSLLEEYYQERPDAKRIYGITSGWRPASYNARVPNASKTSWHIKGKAVDLDDDGPFDRWCMEHPEVLAKYGLWQEHPGWTDGWCHLQTEPPRSSWETRVFIPNWNEPMTSIYGTEPVIYKAS
jgi:hypothetical protein